MQQVGCLNIWEFIATSTSPAALLHLSGEQQVGWWQCLGADCFNHL